MFQFVYNSYFFEWCHNSWIILQSKLWNAQTSTSTTSPVLAITYPDSKSNNDNTNTTNNSTMKEPDNKLHDTSNAFCAVSKFAIDLAPGKSWLVDESVISKLIL